MWPFVELLLIFWSSHLYTLMYVFINLLKSYGEKNYMPPLYNRAKPSQINLYPCTLLNYYLSYALYYTKGILVSSNIFCFFFILLYLFDFSTFVLSIKKIHKIPRIFIWVIY
jgi:hypothetical protein